MMQKMPMAKPIVGLILIHLLSHAPAFGSPKLCWDIVESNSIPDANPGSPNSHSANRVFLRDSRQPAIMLKMTGANVLVEQVKVTGKEYSVIESNLSLTPEVLERMYSSRGEVLSVGEGVSELLPTLLQRRIRAKGLDLWYHSESLNEITDDPEVKKMQTYQARYGAYLIKGDALRMPVKSASQAFVLSHLLMNNLHIAERLKFLSEAFRVLEVGGEARILMDDARTPNLSPTYVNAIVDFIKKNYANAISFELDRSLLIAKKINRLPFGFTPEIPFDANRHYVGVPMGAREFRDKEDRELFAEILRLNEILRHDPGNVLLHQRLDMLIAKRNSGRVVHLDGDY